MEDNENKDEPFRKTLHGTLDEPKWKKIVYIFFVITILALAAAAIFIFLYVAEDNESKNEDNNKNEDETLINWYPAGDRIKTIWGKNLDPDKIWQEYPRPQLERKEWMNLNGLWSYSIRSANDLNPSIHDGNILVPFPIESSLSGVMKKFTKDDILWYEKEIEIPKNWEGKNILINFGAVDWKCEVFYS